MGASTTGAGPEPPKLGFQLSELLIRKLLDVDQRVAGVLDGTEQLIELEVQRAGVVVLSRAAMNAIGLPIVFETRRAIWWKSSFNRRSTLRGGSPTSRYGWW
jgi:hypothetical protein